MRYMCTSVIFSQEVLGQLEELVPKTEAPSAKETRLNNLLNNDFAPVTFRFGFIETSFRTLCVAFEQWHRNLNEKYSLNTEFTSFDAPLAAAFLTLEPLTTPQDRYLLVETRSKWTAIFANGLMVNDVSSPVAYLPSVLNCRGSKWATHLT
jgi:hypothetical protein